MSEHDPSIEEPTKLTQDSLEYAFGLWASDLGERSRWNAGPATLLQAYKAGARWQKAHPDPVEGPSRGLFLPGFVGGEPEDKVDWEWVPGKGWRKRWAVGWGKLNADH